MGELDTLDLATILDTAPSDHYTYLLDSLGNRSAGAAQVLDYAHDTDRDGDGVFDSTYGYETVVDQRNVLGQVTDQASATHDLAYDEIGSLIGDEESHLQSVMHDAWGRLVFWMRYDPGAQPATQYAMYAYDALGRLCKRSAPWPSDYQLSRVETYYCDGVRRIQRVTLRAFARWGEQRPRSNSPAAAR